jgi:hypothetical protein
MSQQCPNLALSRVAAARQQCARFHARPRLPRASKGVSGAQSGVRHGSCRATAQREALRSLKLRRQKASNFVVGIEWKFIFLPAAFVAFDTVVVEDASKDVGHRTNEIEHSANARENLSARHRASRTKCLVDPEDPNAERVCGATRENPAMLSRLVLECKVSLAPAAQKMECRSRHVSECVGKVAGLHIVASGAV